MPRSALELLDYMIENAASVRDHKDERDTIHSRIVELQRELKRAQDLLRLLERESQS